MLGWLWICVLIVTSFRDKKSKKADDYWDAEFEGDQELVNDAAEAVSLGDSNVPVKEDKESSRRLAETQDNKEDEDQEEEPQAGTNSDAPGEPGVQLKVLFNIEVFWL